VPNVSCSHAVMISEAKMLADSDQLLEYILLVVHESSIADILDLVALYNVLADAEE
jgi:hypothetical protein